MHWTKPGESFLTDMIYASMGVAFAQGVLKEATRPAPKKENKEFFFTVEDDDDYDDYDDDYEDDEEDEY
jgi:hypothetical protein